MSFITSVRKNNVCMRERWNERRRERDGKRERERKKENGKIRCFK